MFTFEAPTLSPAERGKLEPTFRALIEDYLGARRVKTPRGLALSVSNRASFVDQAIKAMDSAGIRPPEAGRVVVHWLEAVFDINTRLRRGWRQWKEGLDEVILDEWPFQRLLVSDPGEQMELLARWEETGTPLVGDEMIAAKWSSVWLELSGFGFPFPPFGKWKTDALEDVDRDEASDLGLKIPTHVPEIRALPEPKGFLW